MVTGKQKFGLNTCNAMDTANNCVPGSGIDSFEIHQPEIISVSYDTKLHESSMLICLPNISLIMTKLILLNS